MRREWMIKRKSGESSTYSKLVISCNRSVHGQNLRMLDGIASSGIKNVTILVLLDEQLAICYIKSINNIILISIVHRIESFEK